MNENSKLESFLKLTEVQKKALKRIGLITIKDLLWYFPTRYQFFSDSNSIVNLRVGDNAVLYGTLSHLKLGKSFKKKISMADGMLTDTTGTIKLIWFNQPYLAKMLKDGEAVRVSGKVLERNGEIYIANGDIEPTPSLPVSSKESLFSENGSELFAYPVYPETRGITSKFIYFTLQKIFKNKVHEQIIDPIPTDILQKYNLPQLSSALVWIHSPKKESDAIAARKRFAFEEVFYIQIYVQMQKKEYQNLEGFKLSLDSKSNNEFISRFPFKATNAQLKAIEVIRNDFKIGKPMSRLLEGDVGSGKTAVAATTAYDVVTSSSDIRGIGKYQVAYMAPTEILAEQHFESFIQYFKHLPLQIGLITGSGCKKFPSKLYAENKRTKRGQDAEKNIPWTNISRSQLLKWVKSGDISILIGTHALIQKSVEFRNLAYIVIDEQHRFGIRQRQALARGKSRTEHRQDADSATDALIYRDLTYRIRTSVFNVKKELGLGHKEVIYQKALALEFKKNNLPFSEQVQIPITFRGKKIGTYIPDFVIDNKVVIELKSLPFLGDQPKKQLWQYIKSSDYKLGLLINFGNSDLEIQRVIYDKARIANSASSPQPSAFTPHLLSMTATPIPRTLALTIYGDLDLTLLDEMPTGRKKVITEITPPLQRENVYKKIREELESGRQVYIICPRINDPDPDKEMALQAKSVQSESERLKKTVFREYNIGVVHSKMKPKEKDDIMIKFKNKEIDILVATSVVEVGVNVPNATVIIIEGAERFGLSQLHQLRGRVIRSNHQAYCYLFAESQGEKTKDRLRALIEAKNGFELAELDLKLRGSGELLGSRQWGVSDIGMEAIRNIKMVEAAREEARNIVEKDPELTNFPTIKERLQSKANILHFE